MIKRILSPLCIAVLILSTTSATARAAQSQATDPKAPPVPEAVRVLGPFLDPQVLAIVRVDASKVDLKVLEGWVAKELRAGVAGDKDKSGEIDEAVTEMGAMLAQGEKYRSMFGEAGGRDVYVVLSSTDLMAGGPSVVIPLAPEANAEKVQALFPKESGAERIGNVIVLAPEGTRARLKTKLNAAPAPVEANLVTALAANASAAPDAAVQIAFAPAEGLRMLFSQFSPTLPAELGGGPSAPVLRGFRWATMTIQAPPAPGLRAHVQTQDPKSAEAVEKALLAAFSAGRKAIDAEADRLAAATAANADAIRRFGAILQKLSFKRDGDHLTLVLDENQLRETVGFASTGVLSARRQAKQVQSMSQLRQLSQHCLMWSASNKGQWPETLADALKGENAPPALLINPSKPGTGYTYVKPEKGAKDPSSRIVLYETENAGQGRAAAFMDGHAEYLTETQFQEVMKKQRGEKKTK